MGKNKKKRNKVYSGNDAANTRPIITKLAAADRNKPAQWWFDNKRVAKPLTIASLVIIAVVWLIIELVRIISG